MKERIDR